MFYYWVVCLKLINKSINSFELNPAYYLSTPGYSQDAILSFTENNLKLIFDIEKNQFIESTLTSGISTIF